MPLPLLWLGAGIAAVAAGDYMARQQQKQRGEVGLFPGDEAEPVAPEDGAIICCSIFSWFDHSGIWVDGDIVELYGNGLIRAISPARFLDNRSGKQAFIACDGAAQPLVSPNAAQSALARVYQYSDYHVLRNNCHRFVWNCVAGDDTPLTRFAELNQRLSQWFDCAVHWHPLALTQKDRLGRYDSR